MKTCKSNTTITNNAATENKKSTGESVLLGNYATSIITHKPLNRSADDLCVFLNFAGDTHVHISITNADNHTPNDGRINLTGQMNNFI